MSLGHNGEVSAPAHSSPTDAPGWSSTEVVDRYLDRRDRLAPRRAGEKALVSLLSAGPSSLLDLGCGDGRLAKLALDACPTLDRVVAVDSSPPMLERARREFAGDSRVTVRSWDLARSIAPLGHHDAIVSGFAIHHLEDDRKQRLLLEVADQLQPGGLFANLEVVASATPELHAEFLDLIGRTEDDPEDRLAPVGLQLDWMRDAGLTRVGCIWQWRGFALLVGYGSSPDDGRDSPCP